MNTQTPEDVKQSPPEGREELSRGEVTQLLLDWNNGDAAARDRLLTLVYDQLRRMAHRRLRRERIGHTMRTGTLVHEVYLRLFKADGVLCQNHKEFFGITARLMRQVLVDAARKRENKKCGGDQVRVIMEDSTVVTPAINLDLIALGEALDALASNDEDLSQVVELRCFAGLTIEQTAEILDVSIDTVKRRFNKARIYLHDELTRTKGSRDGS
ncbi:MAG TPA: ECF-type sigma factor [Blastocatellia bacterium]|nr:ECF-type sigma factor [Blastocatellia bacterium]